ncbi:TetR/AcrR family transcriptional regulator [Metabacillus litoralis]|uniref:TetR/AcrR family transcriptional regulator n=1 Tax=Metabacillus litoralis TaxID=152268 RepID=UPI001B995CDB|nr:TetR family transcriptional regulator [Metabacillus litoralis]MCM3160724.1 TetR family transcriptional regulator [Metabacillus litoralis]MCM3411788.1 TetR family transcriptional regulator [Metabacillus litoralis]
MPKQTFYHLPKEKKDTLIHSAKKEFSRVPLHEASIANIIKSAGIPRGSFYQYFDDKEDLYFYLLDEFTQNTNRRVMTILRRKQGDLTETLIDLFQHIVQSQHNQDNKAFFKNVFLNMNYKIENTLARSMYEKSQKSHYLSFLKLVKTDHLNIKCEQELIDMIEIMVSVTIHNLVRVFVLNLSEEEALTKYINQIELLKKGFQKE